MSHFLLPERGDAPTAMRFGDVALAALLEDITKLGGDLRRLRARVYGGSAPPIQTDGQHLGERNVAAALAFLAARSVPVIDRNVGGRGALKIVFSTTLGGADVVRVGAA